MIKRLQLFNDSNNIAINKSNILLAVSGGIDSVVLAHLFSTMGINFGIAHCNFKLRGKESSKDEEFVKNLGAKLQITFHHTSFQTLKIAKLKGISVQMAARELRYNWFEQIRTTFEYDYIATAHHKGDVVETVLFNLTKGTSLSGLHGIKAKNNLLIRPILFASRVEIETYAQNNSIEWREDRSNSSVKYHRNKIRHKVIPLLEEINPKAQDSIYATSVRIKEIELFLEHNVQAFTKKIVNIKKDATHITISGLIKIPGFTYLLHELLKPFGFSYVQTNTIVGSLKGISGKLFYSQSHVVNIDRDQLIVSPIKENFGTELFDETQKNFSFGHLQISTKLVERVDYTIESNNKILALDNSKLHFPLEIRNWKIGDIFYPLGMKGKKKLSDFMIDAKIPVNLKNKVSVVISAGDIVGILEHRLDNRYKITDKTKQVFEIRVID